LKITNKNIKDALGNIKLPKGFTKRQISGAKKLINDKKRKILKEKITAEILNAFVDSLTNITNSNIIILSDADKIMITTKNLEILEKVSENIIKLLEAYPAIRWTR